MLPETLAEFFKLQGYKIFKTDSCYWYNVQSGFYFNLPYHRLITPSKKEVNSVLWGVPCLGVRFFTKTEYQGKLSYFVVASDKNYDITSVDPKSRSQTRRGLDNIQIRRVEFKDLAKYNALNTDTLIRQGRKTGVWTLKRWQTYCNSARGLPGLEAWGAFYDNNLAAFMVGYQMDDYFEILHHSSASEFLHLNPNNALVFYVTKLKLSSNEVNNVCYGPESLDAPASLETFKFRMGFQKLPMKQVIILNPLIQPMINNFSYSFIRRISKRAKSDFWKKLEGIVRFYKEKC